VGPIDFSISDLRAAQAEAKLTLLEGADQQLLVIAICMAVLDSMPDLDLAEESTERKKEKYSRKLFIHLANVFFACFGRSPTFGSAGQTSVAAANWLAAVLAAIRFNADRYLASAAISKNDKLPWDPGRAESFAVFARCVDELPRAAKIARFADGWLAWRTSFPAKRWPPGVWFPYGLGHNGLAGVPRWVRSITIDTIDRLSNADTDGGDPAPHKGGSQPGLDTKKSAQDYDIGRIVVVGNCIAESIETALSGILSDTRQVVVTSIPRHFKQLTDDDSIAALARASMVFLQTNLWSDYEMIMATRPSTCPILSYPNPVLPSLWPFDGFSGALDPNILAKLGPSAPSYFHDMALAELRTIEPDPARRLQRYRQMDFPLARKANRTGIIEMHYVQAVDQECFSDLRYRIPENIKKQQLFYNSTHPSHHILQYLCEFVWERIGIDGAPPRFEGTDGWRGAAVPVHPEIAKSFGLEWATEDTLYSFHDWGRLTWEAWVKRYIAEYG
jgi:hypothetical protein